MALQKRLLLIILQLPYNDCGAEWVDDCRTILLKYQTSTNSAIEPYTAPQRQGRSAGRHARHRAAQQLMHRLSLVVFV